MCIATFHRRPCGHHTISLEPCRQHTSTSPATCLTKIHVTGEDDFRCARWAAATGKRVWRGRVLRWLQTREARPFGEKGGLCQRCKGREKPVLPKVPVFRKEIGDWD